MNQPSEPPVFQSSAAAPVQPSTRRLQDSGLVQNKLAVLAILFFVTGFLGLPLLWICKKFSPAERWTWAIPNTLYTSTLIWIVVSICMWSWSRINAAFQ